MVTFFIFGRVFSPLAPRFVWWLLAPNMEKVTMLAMLLRFLV